MEKKLVTSDLSLITIDGENFSGQFSDSAGFNNLDDLNLKKTILYEYAPELLETRENPKDEFFLSTNLLKSNCPLTGQPDWGTVYLFYKADTKLDEESFLRYIISYRTLGEYHEECCERILFDLSEILQPEELVVFCKYTRRGGIDINPIRVYPEKDNYLDSLPKKFKKIISTREFRQ